MKCWKHTEKSIFLGRQFYRLLYKIGWFNRDSLLLICILDSHFVVKFSRIA